MAPEVLAKDKYSEKADIFSFGVVVYEIFSGNFPYSDPEFRNLNQAQLMYQIIEYGARPALDCLHPSLQQLVGDCWNMDAKLRPSFNEIIVRLRRLKGIIDQVLVLKDIKQHPLSVSSTSFDKEEYEDEYESLLSFEEPPIN